MNERNSFSDLQAHLAPRELSPFIAAATDLCGPVQARLAAEDWLDESDLMSRCNRTALPPSEVGIGTQCEHRSRPRNNSTKNRKHSLGAGEDRCLTRIHAVAAENA